MKRAVVLLNMGGPDSLEAVEPFLLNLFSDPEILRFPFSGLIQRPLARWISSRRAPGVVEKYREIGGKSPLWEITEAQARALLAELGGADAGWSVHVAMRYWNPRAEVAVRAVKDSGARSVVLLPLYPHFSRATTGSSLQDWRNSSCGLGLVGEGEVEIPHWYDFPPYVEALVETVREGLEGLPGATVLFSAHGLPVKLIREGDPYLEHVRGTVAAVTAGLPGVPWELAFQSRAGPVRWLEPSTPDVLRRLAAGGTKDVLVVPVSFVSDHIETLHEIDIEFAALARSLGFRNFRRSPSLNVRPGFIRALAALVRSAGERAGEKG